MNTQTDLNVCAKLMIENKISSIIVTDDKGSLKGIFTKSDLIEIYGKYYKGKDTVKEYMSKEVLTCGTRRANTYGSFIDDKG